MNLLEICTHEQESYYKFCKILSKNNFRKANATKIIFGVVFSYNNT